MDFTGCAGALKDFFMELCLVRWSPKIFFYGFYLVWRSSQKNLWILPGVVKPKSIFLGIFPGVKKPRNFSMDFTWSGGAQINFLWIFPSVKKPQNHFLWILSGMVKPKPIFLWIWPHFHPEKSEILGIASDPCRFWWEFCARSCFPGSPKGNVWEQRMQWWECRRAGSDDPSAWEGKSFQKIIPAPTFPQETALGMNILGFSKFWKHRLVLLGAEEARGGHKSHFSPLWKQIFPIFPFNSTSWSGSHAAALRWDAIPWGYSCLG